MESMLRDVENAKKMNDKWTNLVKRRKDLSSDASALKVVILSQASWPSSTISSSKFSTKLPEKVSNWIQEYTKSIAMNEAHFAGAHFVVCESLGSVVMTLKFMKMLNVQNYYKLLDFFGSKEKVVNPHYVCRIILLLKTVDV